MRGRGPKHGSVYILSGQAGQKGGGLGMAVYILLDHCGHQGGGPGMAVNVLECSRQHDC